MSEVKLAPVKWKAKTTTREYQAGYRAARRDNNMTLEQFAKQAGVKLLRCDAAVWFGSYGYTTKDAPNCKMLGFRTEQSAYKRWLEDTVGKQMAKAIKKLLGDKK